MPELDRGKTYNDHVSGARVKRSHERFKQEYASKKRCKHARKEQDDREAREDAKVPLPPRKLGALGIASAILRSTSLDTEGPSAAPSDRQSSFADPPGFDEGYGPQDEKGGIDCGVRHAQEEETDAQSGDIDQRLRV